MHHFVSVLLHIVSLHAYLFYGAIFLISLSESLALIGLFIPGTVIMFSIGAVVSTGSLELKLVLLAAILGAIVGDGLSFWFGYKFKGELGRIWPFNCFPGIMAKGEDFFRRHGGKSILFGRFVGPVRPVIPVIAGMLGMNPFRFLIVNVVSAIGWALVYILPGVLLGTSLAVAGAVSMRLAALALVLLAFIWLFVRLGQKLVSSLSSRGPAWLSALERWMVSDSPTAKPGNLLKRAASWLIMRPRGEEIFLGVLVLVMIGAAWGFFSILHEVLVKDPLVLTDQAVYHFFRALRTPWADRLFVALTEFGDSFVNICLFSAVFLVLAVKRCRRTMFFWTVTVIGGLAGVQLLKWIIRLPRPIAIYHGSSAFGFPSGHTTMSVVIYGFLAILLSRNSQGRLRQGIFVTVFLISFVIAVSRIYLGAHWLSDVIGGLFVGTAWSFLMGIAWLKNADEKVPRRLLGLATLFVVIVAGGWHIGRRHQADMAFYAVQPDKQTLSYHLWQDSGWQGLPAWRTDMAGEKEQPLTFQWAGSPNKIVRILVETGWQKPTLPNLNTMLGIIAPNPNIEDLPVLPMLQSGVPDIIRLVHPYKNGRLVIRMWPSEFRFAKSGTPIFLGTIMVEKPRALPLLFTIPWNTGEYDAPQQWLEKRLKARVFAKEVRRTEIGTSGESIKWNGRVLLFHGQGATGT